MAFEGTRKKMYEAINGMLPSPIAMALVESSGAGSEDEIRFLAGLVSQFKNVVFHSNVNGRKGIKLKALYAEDEAYKNFHLIFSFQHRVKNVTPHSPDWRVDMAVFIYANFPLEEQQIGGLALEYDGHPSHYLETSIKKQMVRDVHILDREMLPVLRVNPEMASKDPALYRMALRKFVRHSIASHTTTVKETQRITINLLTSAQDKQERQHVAPAADKIDRFIDCPVCKTYGYFGPIPCDLCHGHGRVRRSETMRDDIQDFSSIRCLACYPDTASGTCRHCRGTGKMDNIQALDYAKKHETFETRQKSYFH